jgi:flagellar protein FlgJ
MSSAILPNVFDASGLAAIKRQVRSNDPAALKAAAQQFEALFLQMVLKSMRDATPKEGLFDSDQTRLYESLLDQQMAQVMAAKGGTGLARLIESQLSRNADVSAAATFDNGLPLNPPAVPRLLRETPRAVPPMTRAAGSQPAAVVPDSAPARDFVSAIWPHAVDASRAVGVPAEFLVAHAALETGWGRAAPRRADGQSSYNLFGIKAGQNWNGPTADATTTEYVDGIARQRVERFRAYGSYAEAFRDYASLLGSSARYAAVIGAADATSFARGLQRAGYATDPAYAEKLTRIIGRVTGQTTA